MLLVQNGEITEIREFIQFQYIICCWFNGLGFSWDDWIAYFNTLYVVGSRVNPLNATRVVVDFNTLYVVGSIIGT